MVLFVQTIIIPILLQTVWLKCNHNFRKALIQKHAHQSIVMKFPLSLHTWFGMQQQFPPASYGICMSLSCHFLYFLSHFGYLSLSLLRHPPPTFPFIFSFFFPSLPSLQFPSLFSNSLSPHPPSILSSILSITLSVYAEQSECDVFVCVTM